MKRSMAVIFTVILMTSLTSCSKDINQEIEKRYRELESYQAKTQLYVSDAYDTKEYLLQGDFQAPDHYRTEVIAPEHLKGTVCVISGDGMWFQSQDTPKVQMERKPTELPFDFVFVADFFQTYFAQGGEATETADGNVILHIQNHGERYRYSCSLELDGKTLLPKTMRTFDQNGAEVLRSEFLEFSLNQPKQE